MLNQTTLLDGLPSKRFQFISGELCLDFCNTMGGKREGTPREKLHSHDEFLAWCKQANLISHSKGVVLKTKADEDQSKASSVLARAIELRESSYRVFFAIIQGAQPSEADIAIINAELARSLGRMRIGGNPSGKSFEWTWAQEPVELDDQLGPLAYSAASLLASDTDLAHLRQCRGDNCGWLFIDASKNHSRCWCDMRDCGNLAKVRRHRQKQRPI